MLHRFPFDVRPAVLKGLIALLFVVLHLLASTVWPQHPEGSWWWPSSLFILALPSTLFILDQRRLEAAPAPRTRKGRWLHLLARFAVYCAAATTMTMLATLLQQSGQSDGGMALISFLMSLLVYATVALALEERLHRNSR